MNLFQLNKKLNSINPNEIFKSKLNIHLDDILFLNKDQLMEGKTNKEVNITPSYSNDSYFKSKESAERYKKWKERITYDPRRDADSPNMFINGAFHKSIYISLGNNTYKIDSDSIKANDITAKFQNLFGLYPKNKEKIKTKLIIESWNDVIKKLK